METVSRGGGRSGHRQGGGLVEGTEPWSNLRATVDLRARKGHHMQRRLQPLPVQGHA